MKTDRRILAALTLAIYALVLGWSFVGHQHLFLSAPASHAGIAQPSAGAHGGHDADSCPACAFAHGSNAHISGASPSAEGVRTITPTNPYATAAPRVPFAAPANPRAPPAA